MRLIDLEGVAQSRLRDLPYRAYLRAMGEIAHELCEEYAEFYPDHIVGLMRQTVDAVLAAVQAGDTVGYEAAAGLPGQWESTLNGESDFDAPSACNTALIMFAALSAEIALEARQKEALAVVTASVSTYPGRPYIRSEPVVEFNWRTREADEGSPGVQLLRKICRIADSAALIEDEGTGNPSLRVHSSLKERAGVTRV